MKKTETSSVHLIARANFSRAKLFTFILIVSSTWLWLFLLVSWFLIGFYCLTSIKKSIYLLVRLDYQVLWVNLSMRKTSSKIQLVRRCPLICCINTVKHETPQIIQFFRNNFSSSTRIFLNLKLKTNKNENIFKFSNRQFLLCATNLIHILTFNGKNVECRTHNNVCNLTIIHISIYQLQCENQ